jgi:hypothetical protein
VALTAAQAAVYREVPFVIKAAVEMHMRAVITDMTFDNVSAILITAGLNSLLTRPV